MRKYVRKAKAAGIEYVTFDDFDPAQSKELTRKKLINNLLYKIASESGFFYSLEVINQELLDEIVLSGRPFSFLSAPLGNYSVDDKRAWVRDRLGLDVEVIVVPREQKIMYCKPNDILIDDHPDTIEEWRNAGGVAIWHPFETFEA